MATVPFSLTAQSPANGTIVKRSWARTETPPANYEVVFTPANPGDKLTGAPANRFLDPAPPAGVKLVAVLPAPQNRNQTLVYSLDVQANGKTSVNMTFDLHYEG